jgi:hypothetical protein
VLKAPRLAIFLIVGLAVPASGCGSTKTVSTTTTTASAPTTASTSTNAGTTAPARKGAQTATQSTGAKNAPHTTAPKAKPQRREKAAEAKPQRVVKALKKTAEELELGRGSSEKSPPHRFPRLFQLRFIVSCEAAKGSNSSCECILTKLEKSNVEKGQSIAELLVLQGELQSGTSFQAVARGRVRLPRKVKRYTKECGSRSK